METHQPNSEFRKLTRDEAYEIREPIPADAQLPEDNLLREPVEKLANEVRSEAIKLIEAGIDAGVLPESVRERLPFLRQMDFFLNEQRGGGGYNSNQMAASVDSGIYGLSINFEEVDSVWHAKIDYPEASRKNLVHITVHEFLHALSGARYYIKDGQLSSHGIGLDASTDKEPREFRWLSEAMTERLTLQLLALNKDNSTAHAYNYEMKLLNLIIVKSRVPIENALIEAYFEDREPIGDFPKATEYKINPEQPARQRLGQIVTEGFDRGFLNRLNRLVIKENLAFAIKALEDDEFTPEKIEFIH